MLIDWIEFKLSAIKTKKLKLNNAYFSKHPVMDIHNLLNNSETPVTICFKLQELSVPVDDYNKIKCKQTYKTSFIHIHATL